MHTWLKNQVCKLRWFDKHHPYKHLAPLLSKSSRIHSQQIQSQLTCCPACTTWKWSAGSPETGARSSNWIAAPSSLPSSTDLTHQPPSWSASFSDCFTSLPLDTPAVISHVSTALPSGIAWMNTYTGTLDCCLSSAFNVRLLMFLQVCHFFLGKFVFSH